MVRAKLAMILCAAALLLAGSGCEIFEGADAENEKQQQQAAAKEAAADKSTQAKQAKRPGQPPHVPQRYEKDPVPVADKVQQGFNYDPTVFEQGAYRPDELKDMIESKGSEGLVQQTFAEAGGDFDVDVDRTGLWMAYSTTRFGKTPDICIQSVKGRAVQLKTNDGASDMMPKFSPDAKLIAWCSNRYGNWDILLTTVDSTPDSRPQQLTYSTEDEIHPSWSYDGKLMAFSRYSAMDGVWNIWVMDMQTRTICAVTEGLFPEFRPVAEKGADGKEVYAMTYQRNRKRDIPWYSVWTIRVKPDKSGKVDLADSPMEIISNNEWAAINPCYSPDGKYIAFASVRKSPLSQMEARIYRADDIWVVREDGADLTQITSHASPDWSPCWAKDESSPNGRLFFSSLRNGHPNIWSGNPQIAGMLLNQGAPQPNATPLPVK